MGPFVGTIGLTRRMAFASIRHARVCLVGSVAPLIYRTDALPSPNKTRLYLSRFLYFSILCLNQPARCFYCSPHRHQAQLAINRLGSKTFDPEVVPSWHCHARG